MQVIFIVTHEWFDLFILVAILFNSIAMALGEYEHIYTDPSDPSTYEAKGFESFTFKTS